MMESLKDRAYQHIWEEMASGRIAPGAHLSDVSLAKTIGISRTPVREAILVLEMQGLVEQVAGMGARVKSLDRRQLDELFDLREILEAAAASRAAERISEAELTELKNNCDQYLEIVRSLKSPGSNGNGPLKVFDRLIVLDMAFHLRLIRASRNRRLVRVVADLHVLGRILRRRAELPGVSMLSRFSLAWRDHTRIVRALRRRDSAAAAHWMSQHVRRACKYHLEAHDWHQRQENSGIAAHQDLPLHVQHLLARMEGDQTVVEEKVQDAPRPLRALKSGRKKRIASDDRP